MATRRLYSSWRKEDHRGRARDLSTRYSGNVTSAAGERNRYLENLFARTETRVVISVRSDYYGDCAEHPVLAEALRDNQVLVGPMSEDERAVQKLAIAVVNRCGHDVDAQLDEVIDRIGYAQAMAVLFLTGRYVMHAYVVNALNLAPPVSSIFAGGRP